MQFIKNLWKLDLIHKSMSLVSLGIAQTSPNSVTNEVSTHHHLRKTIKEWLLEDS